jgi:hypothetical protein
VKQVRVPNNTNKNIKKSSTEESEKKNGDKHSAPNEPALLDPNLARLEPSQKAREPAHI